MKIGITGCPQERIKQLGGVKRFEIVDSVLLESDSERFIRLLESFLHFRFAAHSTQEHDPLNEGNTEVFRYYSVGEVVKEAFTLSGLFETNSMVEFMTELNKSGEVAGDFNEAINVTYQIYPRYPLTVRAINSDGSVGAPL